MKQGESETESVPADENIDSFVTRLRKKATRCSFTDNDTQIKYQIIFGCSSSKLRREGLKKDDQTLNDLITLGRGLETVRRQAKVMENKKSEEVNMVRPGRYSRKFKNRESLKPKNKEDYSSAACFYCGGGFPHQGGRKKCPAWGKSCMKCNLSNHFAAQCKNKKVDIIQSSRMADTSTSSSEEEYVYSENDSENDVEVVESIKREKKINLKTLVTLKIEGIPMKMNVDTGASWNLIDGSSFQKIRSCVKLKKISTKFIRTVLKSLSIYWENLMQLLFSLLQYER